MSEETTLTLQKFVQGDTLRQEMAKVLPKHLTPERMARIAWTAIVRNPELKNCERDSLATAIILCAQAGLEPDGRLAHLIPFGKKVQVIFDYKGLVVLAKRNGIDVKANLVREHDFFEYIEDDGTGKTVLRHSFDPCSDRGNVTGVYSRAIENGKPDYEFMSMTEVENTRKYSKAGSNGPWVTQPGEMAKKTAIKRHSKRWDLLPEVRDVINAEDDTPPPLNVSAVTTPIFTPLPPATDSDSHLFAANPGTPEPNAKLKNLRDLIANRNKDGIKIRETEWLGFLVEVGASETAYESLEQLAEKDPKVLQMSIDQFSDIADRIQQAKAIHE